MSGLQAEVFDRNWDMQGNVSIKDIIIYDYITQGIIIIIVLLLLTQAWAEGYSNRCVCLSVCLCVTRYSMKYVFCMKQYSNGKSTYYSINNMCELLQNHFVSREN